MFGEENRGLFNKRLISFEVITENLWRTLSLYLGPWNLLNEWGSDSYNDDSSSREEFLCWVKTVHYHWSDLDSVQDLNCLMGCIAGIFCGLFKHFCLQMCRVNYLWHRETALPVGWMVLLNCGQLNSLDKIWIFVKSMVFANNSWQWIICKASMN